MLYVFAAPSGTGKTTLVKRILEQNPELVFSVSATTREKREGEVDGKDYFFIKKEEFEKKIIEGEFLEYEKVFGDNYYGTLKSFVEDVLKKGKSLVLDLDVNGALSIKKIYGGKAVLIFICPPNKDVVIKRLTGRGTEDSEKINQRLARFDYEMGKMNEFDVVVVNNDLETALNEIQKIIEEKK
ncbi:MAG: guanylate kinase [Ignavibacteria bacterium]